MASVSASSAPAAAASVVGASATKPQKPLPSWVNFVVGGVAGMMSTCVVQPIDLLKTRMQLLGGERANVFQVFRQVLKNEGVAAMYNGLSAGLLRQATYTTARLGIFNGLNDALQQRAGKNLPFWQKLGVGAVAGGLAAMVGNPAEVALLRMMADGRLPVEQRRNYTWVGQALIRVVREESVLTLWRGATPTVIRAMVMNMSQVATYQQFKEMLLGYGMPDGFPQHLTASMMSALCATTASLPFDMCKTRLQTMKGREYTSMMDVAFKVIRHEGPFALWKGFLPFFLRLGPHTVLTFIFMEQMNTMFRKVLA